MKRISSVILVVILCLSLLPVGVLADEEVFAPEEAASEAPAMATPPAPPPGGGGGSSSSITYSGATTITSATTQSGKTYSSTTVDQSALLINTSKGVTIENPTVTKSGSSNGGDSCSFYGLNAAVLVMGGSTTTITGGRISSSASGANGVFSYGGNRGTNGAAGDGTTVNISGTTITTTGSGSGGIMTTGGGITNAYNLTVTTSGGSSAPIRTDRGGGTVYVNGGTYTANGLGSPVIYSTASVTAENATLVSNLSEGVCIEGKNSITLINCDLTANNTRRNGNATFLDTIMIYQSMSGDADSGNSKFTMTGGRLTSNSGHVFHVTNTNAFIDLSGVEIVNNDKAGVLLSVCDDGWSGSSNTATLTASDQTLEGAILVGSDSSLTMRLSGSSVFQGYVSGSITNAAGTRVSSSVGTVKVTLDSGTKWKLTADSYITSFSGSASNVISNGHTLYVNGKALAGVSERDDVNGLADLGDGWKYYVDGKVDTGYTGLAENEYGWWYVKNGVLDLTFTGLVENEYGTWFIYKGQLANWRTGFDIVDGEWHEFYLGQLTTWKTEPALVNPSGDAATWVIMRAGSMDTGYTGLAENEYGWWYVQNGVLDLTYTGLATNENGTFYVYKGQFANWRTGCEWVNDEYCEFYLGQLTTWKTDATLVNPSGDTVTWVSMRCGKVDMSYTGLANNEYGWWYVFDGLLNFDFTGLVENPYGTWFVYKGQLADWREDFEWIGDELCYIYKGQLATWITGPMEYNGSTVNVTEGKVVS